jgi:hypothetical protein
MTQTQVDLIVGVVEIVCLIVCFLKWKFWTVILTYLTVIIVLVTVVGPQYGVRISDGPFRLVALAVTGIAGMSCGLFQARKADQNAFINAL